MDPLGILGAPGAIATLGGYLAEVLADFLAGAPDDPVLLLGAILLAWLPLCAVVLAALALVARAQVAFVRRRRPRLSPLPSVEARRPLVTRRFITNPRRTNGALATARLALAVGVVLGFTAVLLASSGPLLLASLRG